MRGVYTVDQIRAAEDALMARLPEGALMQRAGVRAGPGSACSCSDGPTARGSCCWSAPATTAATRSGPAHSSPGAGCRSRRCCSIATRAHADGLDALERAGMDGPSTRIRALIAGADLVLDGIVGIGGKGGLRQNAVPLARAAARAMHDGRGRRPVRRGRRHRRVRIRRLR